MFYIIVINITDVPISKLYSHSDAWSPFYCHDSFARSRATCGSHHSQGSPSFIINLRSSSDCPDKNMVKRRRFVKHWLFTFVFWLPWQKYGQASSICQALTFRQALTLLVYHVSRSCSRGDEVIGNGSQGRRSSWTRDIYQAKSTSFNNLNDFTSF